MEIRTIHHVSLTVTNLEQSRQFYREIMSLPEIARPAFPFPGAWFGIGESQQLHLIIHSDAIFRGAKGIDTRDVHFAVRVPSFHETIEFLRSRGYSEDADASGMLRMVVRPRATAGFPQIYILDPDNHVIEINAAALD